MQVQGVSGELWTMNHCRFHSHGDVILSRAPRAFCEVRRRRTPSGLTQPIVLESSPARKFRIERLKEKSCQKFGQERNPWGPSAPRSKSRDAALRITILWIGRLKPCSPVSHRE